MPLRVVSLVPSLTAAAARLGRGSEIVGITDYCSEPAEVVARAVRIGGTKNPDLDRIASLRPDVVLANDDEQRGATLEQLLERFGPDVVCVTETDDLDQVSATWRLLGQVLDAVPAAERERDALREVREEVAAATALRPRLAVLVPVWMQPWMATGHGTYVASLLCACGFDNVWSGVDEKWLRFALSNDPDDAGVVAKGPARGQSVHALPRVPDVVLLPTEPYVFDESHRSSFATIGVPQERVRVVDGQLLTWWLSHTVEALRTFSHLHEELVTDAAREAAHAAGLGRPEPS